MNSLTHMEQLLFSTVRVSTDLRTGTGTLVGHPLGSQGHALFLVTNNHVVESGRYLQFIMTKAMNDFPLLREGLEVRITNFQDYWTPHPSADLGVLPLAPYLSDLAGRGIHLFFRFLQTGMFPTSNEIQMELDALEDVIFIGYPNGIYDRCNLTPIVRRGITATPFALDYLNEPAFLIDASVFPGSSGSPVVRRYTGWSRVPITIHGAIKPIFFLGLLTSMLVRSSNDNFTMLPISEALPDRNNADTLNLGRVLKSSLILEVIEYWLAHPPKTIHYETLENSIGPQQT